MQINSKIKRIVKKEVKTRFGLKWKYSLLIVGKNNKDVWIQAWDHSLVRKLREGDQLIGEVEQGEYNGQPQYTFKPPRLEEIILEKLERIEALLGNRSGNELPPPHGDEDAPEEEEEELPTAADSDVPF